MTGDFTPEESTLVAQAVTQLFDAIPHPTQHGFHQNFHRILHFIAAASKAAEETPKLADSIKTGP